MFQHIPVWYQPARVGAADLQRTRDDLVAAVDALSRQFNGDRPFEVRFTQRQVNEWLSARAQVWPAAQRWIPPEIEDPFVAFEPGRIRLAATVCVRGLRTIASATTQIRVEAPGVFLRLLNVQCGSLPLPAAWVPGGLSQFGDSDAPRPDRPDSPTARDLLRGVYLRNEFTWPNGNRRFRLRAIHVEVGAVTVVAEPLPRS